MGVDFLQEKGWQGQFAILCKFKENPGQAPPGIFLWASRFGAAMGAISY